MRVSLPKPFDGTEDEKRANRATHLFLSDMDGETRCSNCDCRPTHRAAEYPCGAEVPRIYSDDPVPLGDWKPEVPDVLDLTDPLVTAKVRADVLENLHR